MFKNIFKKFRRDKELNLIKAEDSRIITLWTAGIKYDSRLKNVLNCKVHEMVNLVREPDNNVDSNAIHVERLNGESLGYIGKSKAKMLASLIDDGSMVPQAQIIDIKCDLNKDIYGVKIAFYVNSYHIDLFAQKIENIDVFFDTSDAGNLYLLLKCEESILKIVKALFKEHNIDIYRSGISYRVAKNGKHYDWYFFLNENESKDLIQKILEDRFSVLKEKSESEFKKEYYSLLEDDYENLEKIKKKLIEEELPSREKELSNLKDSFNVLLNENSKLKCSLEKSNKLLNQSENQLEKTISVLFPDVTFINPSFDVLQREVLDYSNALSKIKCIVSDINFKGKPMKTLNNWFDTHFSTGERNDGRIYFKKHDSKITILVSFKGQQSKDVKRLSKY